MQRYLVKAMGVLVLLGATQAHAANVYWTNRTDGSTINWSDTSGVWSGGAPAGSPPAGADTVYFTNQNAYTVNLPLGTGVVTTNFSAQFNAKDSVGGATVYLNIGTGNTWLLTNGNLRISGNSAADSNTLNNVILTSGTLINTNPVNAFFIGAFGKGSLTVSNGAAVQSGKLNFGNAATAAGTLTIAGGSLTNITSMTVGNASNGVGTVWVLGGALSSTPVINLGNASFSIGSLTTSNGTVDASAAGINVGGSGASITGAVGRLTVAGGLVKASQVTVGRTSSTGTVFITNGGALEANAYTLAAHTANLVTNDGGVYQFTSATPTLTVAGSGGIFLNNGVISFRAITNANVNSALTGIVFSGANTFMLNAARNTTGSSQDYTFDTGSRYANLALVNGETVYRNGNVTIGAGGTFLAKDTQASVSGIFTNSGAVTLLRSTVSYGDALVLNGGSTWQQDFGTNSSTVSVSGSLTFNGAATLNVADAGGFTAQTYTVLTYNAASPIAGAGTLTVGTIPGGFIGQVITNTQGVVLLQVALANGAPSAQFSGSPTHGVEPLPVRFTDLSIGSPTHWAWDFGDGTTSTNQNPSHSYTNGTYTVRLIAGNDYGCTTNTKPACIVVTVSNTPPPTASFTAVPTSGVEPLPVIFTDTSGGTPTSWFWDFDNDGVIDSTGQHPTNTFAAGTWTVSLIASNAGGASAPATQTITVVTAGSVDSDGDGLSDSDEINTYHTDPSRGDTDGDGAGDWYEVFASFTDPNNPADKPNVPYPLPKPDSSTGATNKPVKVFMLMGQSNTVGPGLVDPINTNGTLATIVRVQNKFPNLLDTNGNWSVRQDVMYKGVVAGVVSGPLTVGQGSGSGTIGPELGFGHMMGYYLAEPVLVIKAARANQSLGFDFLPPGSPRYTLNGTNYAGYGDWAPSWPTNSSPPTSGTSYAGQTYDDCVSAAKGVLTNFNTLYPQYAAQGYQVAGICWVQGENDTGTDGIYSSRYETNLVSFINQVRADFGVTNAPFVVATLGQNGTNMTGGYLMVCNAQLAVGNPIKHPEFAGTVKTMDSRKYWRSAAESPVSNQDHHYHQNAETYMLIGDALGRGMIDLLKAGTVNDYATWAAHWPNADLTDPDADYDGDGLSNTNEFLGGFNPTNPAANLRITSITRSNNDIVVTYQASNGDTTYNGGPATRTNILEFAPSITNTFVGIVRTDILSGGTGQGTNITVTDSGGATNLPSRFYRARVLAQ